MRRAVWAVVALHLLNMRFFIYSMKTPSDRESRLHRIYPAKALAQKMALDWANATFCPSRFVVGSSFEAGMASMYLQGYPKVLETGDYHKSPWITPAEIEASGALYVVANEEAFAPGVRELGNYQITDKKGKTIRRIRWGLAAPRTPCAIPPDRSIAGGSSLAVGRVSN